VPTNLDLENLSANLRAHKDYTRAVISERDALRKEVELQKYNVDTWYERFMEAAKHCHELQALDAARAALEKQA
jgi:hypothetical protein